MTHSDVLEPAAGAAPQGRWRTHLTRDVHAYYQVDVAALATDLGADLSADGLLVFRDLDNLTKDELAGIRDACAGYYEYVGAKKALVKSVMGKAEQDVHRQKALAMERIQQRFRDEGEKVSFERLSILTKGDEAVVHAETVRAKYEGYFDYLWNLLKVLEFTHYTAKSILGEQRKPINNANSY